MTCCTIDWFSEWPEQALISVANTFISEMPEVDPDHTNVEGLVRYQRYFLTFLEKSLPTDINNGFIFKFQGFVVNYFLDCCFFIVLLIDCG